MKKIFVILFTLLTVSVYGQTDSIGVYAVRENSVSRIDILKYEQTKISAGLLGGKAKLSFADPTSKNVFNGAATFRVFYANPSVNDMINYYMFTPSYSIKNLGVGKFDIKKNTRLLTSAKVRIFGTTTIGADKVDDVVMETKQIRPNVYEIRITAPVGEYCLMPVVNGAGGYTGVFDFTIKQ